MTRRGLLAACALICASAVPVAGAQEGERGAALYELCATCHGEEGGGRRPYLAPAIAGMPKWYVVLQLRKFQSGLRGTHFDDIAGMRMRPMSLVLTKDGDLEAVAGHVAAMAPVRPAREVEGGDPVRGATLYGPCSGCHGLRGEGVEPVGGSPLTNASDWYVLEQLQKFKSGVRGSHPDDAIAATMRPMALALSDQDMRDLTAYIATLVASEED